MLLAEAFAAVTGGISAKLYDDAIDSKLAVSETWKESLKGIQWISLALLSITDFNFTAVMYLMNMSAYMGDAEAYTTPYEGALLCVYPIFLLLSMHTMVPFSGIDALLSLFLLVILFTEPFIVNKDVSGMKFFCRVGSAFFSWMLLLFAIDNGVSESLIKMFIYSATYLTVSSVFQLHSLFNRIEAGGLDAEVLSIVHDLIDSMLRVKHLFV